MKQRPRFGLTDQLWRYRLVISPVTTRQYRLNRLDRLISNLTHALKLDNHNTDIVQPLPIAQTISSMSRLMRVDFPLSIRLNDLSELIAHTSHTVSQRQALQSKGTEMPGSKGKRGSVRVSSGSASPARQGQEEKLDWRTRHERVCTRHSRLSISEWDASPGLAKGKQARRTIHVLDSSLDSLKCNLCCRIRFQRHLLSPHNDIILMIRRERLSFDLSSASLCACYNFIGKGRKHVPASASNRIRTFEKFAGYLARLPALFCSPKIIRSSFFFFVSKNPKHRESALRTLKASLITTPVAFAVGKFIGEYGFMNVTRLVHFCFLSLIFLPFGLISLHGLTPKYQPLTDCTMKKTLKDCKSKMLEKAKFILDAERAALKHI
ncbi:hypothetical protein KSP40_PGU015341 [Platanthera guangdongensis]|uniref:Uncharacterized protein n=1 Tax=Platanthera guangdongensis TaxID=2320717 RepID=A0ABR2LU09_9ASPA